MKTKDKILLGARNYLLKNGQFGFSIRSIAAEADVNQGLVHHYFGSKDNLMVELMDSIAIEPFELAKEKISTVSKGNIKNVILEILLRNRDLMKLLIEFIYYSQHSPLVKAKLKVMMKERREFVTSALGIEDEDDRYAFNAGIFGIILVNGIDDHSDIETAIRKLFERFNLID